MDRDQLMSMAPTGQVRVLVMELLSDGGIHSRKEMVDYAQNQGRRYGLAPFREGHITGGVREAITNMNCVKLDRAMYRAEQTENVGNMGNVGRNGEINAMAMPPTVSEQAAAVCVDVRRRMTDLSRRIDYVTAGDEELELLARIRECVKKMEEFEAEFRQAGI